MEFPISDTVRRRGYMGHHQTKMIYLAVAIALLAWIVTPFIFTVRNEIPRLSQTPLNFDGAAAYQLTQDFVTQFPQRALGSLESRLSTGYIHDYLGKLGYSFAYTHFDARIARRKQVGRNILAFRQGQSNEILALVAHSDTARTTVQGAMDNGSGVGVLLELARVFAATPTRKSILLILSDGEEWGSLGARDLAANYPDRNKIAAVLSLDHVGIGDLRALCLEETGQLKGFSPPWLRRLAFQAAESQGIPVQSASGFSEYLSRTLLISWADQGPFLNQGIPAINLGSLSKDRAREREIYHSAQDTIGNLKPASIGIFGRAAERIVRSLDEMNSIPKNAPDAFRFWDTRFVPATIMLALQVLLFLPPAITFIFFLRNDGASFSLIGAGREFLAFVGTALPFWVIIPLIALTHALRLLPLYTLYPATLKDPVLETPRWGVLAGIFGTALFVAVILYVIARFSFKNLPKPNFQASKTVLMVLFLVGTILSFVHNPFWASFFLTLPGWIWFFSGDGKTGSGNKARVWIAAAGIPYYAALWIYCSRLEMGWNFIWYQVLALNNGLFTRQGFFLATAMIAIGLRFLAIQSHERKDTTD